MKILNENLEKENQKTLVFVDTKRKADDLTRSMRRDGWPVLCIHGDKQQSERDWVMKGIFHNKFYTSFQMLLTCIAASEFKSSKTPILIATDVAARGLHVDDIRFVINYDYPNSRQTAKRF